jgi:hypothetical protein
MSYLTSTRVRRKGQAAGHHGEIACDASAGVYRRANRFWEADP